MKTLFCTLLLLSAIRSYSQCNPAFSSSANGTTVSFTSNATTSSGTIVSYSWNFGDGNTSTSQNPVHIYSTPGCYTVTHSVQNNTGTCSNTANSVVCVAAAGGPAINWQRTYGGPGLDLGYHIVNTPGGGIIMCGETNGVGGDVTTTKGLKDAWVVKTSANGTIEWEKSFGGSMNDYFTSIKPTSDGGYIAVGESFSNDQDVTGHHGATSLSDCWVVKMSSTGIIEWQKSLGGSNSELGNDIIAVANGYVITGYTTSVDGDVSGIHGSPSSNDVWVVKLNTAGTIQWQKCLGGNNSDYGKSILATTDGGLIVGAMTASVDGDLTGTSGVPGYMDYWFIKLNSTGAIQWQRRYGGSQDDIGNSLCITTDGGFAITGMTFSQDGDVTGALAGSNAWVVKISSSGTLEWKKALGGTGDDGSYDITATADGGVAIAGHTHSNNGDLPGHFGSTATSDYWVSKLSATGQIQWVKNFGGTAEDAAASIQQLADGRFLVTGVTASNDNDVSGNHGVGDIWTIELNSTVLPVKLSDFTATKQGIVNILKWTVSTEVNMRSYEVERSTNGINYIKIGNVHPGVLSYSFSDQSPVQGKNYYRIKMIDNDGLYQYSAVRILNHERVFQANVYPNPASDKIMLQVITEKAMKLQYKVIGVDGRVHLNGELLFQPGEGSKSMNIRSLSPGNYVLIVLPNDEEPVITQFVKS